MYILRISSKAFIQVKPDEVVITSDYEKATKYNTIGEAMRKNNRAIAKLNCCLDNIAGLQFL